MLLFVWNKEGSGFWSFVEVGFLLKWVSVGCELVKGVCFSAFLRMRLSSSSSSSGFNHQPQEGMDFLYALFGTLVFFVLVKFITFAEALVNSLSLYVCVFVRGIVLHSYVCSFCLWFSWKWWIPKAIIICRCVNSKRRSLNTRSAFLFLLVWLCLYGVISPKTKQHCMHIFLSVWEIEFDVTNLTIVC